MTLHVPLNDPHVDLFFVLSQGPKICRKLRKTKKKKKVAVERSYLIALNHKQLQLIILDELF